MKTEMMLGAAGAVDVTARLHPMRSENVVAVVHAGQSIAAILRDLAERNSIRDWYQQDVYVELNGVPVLAADYATTFVSRTDHLTVQFCVPRGGGKKGGKNPLRTILMIVVMIVAWYAGGVVAGIYGQAAGAMAQAAVMMVGGMAVNALVPPTTLTDTGLGHDSSLESDIYSISGMRNYLPRYKALPMVLGRMRFAPPYGAMPYTRLEGNDQYLHCDVVWGHGELQIEDLRIGETPIGVFSDVELATNTGTVDDQPLSLYPDDVWEEGLGITLKAGVENIRRSQQDAEHIGVDLVFAQGLFKVDAETGEKKATEVELEISVCQAGSDVWTTVGHSVVDTAVYPKRLHFDVPITEPGQFDVKIVRITADADTVQAETDCGDIFDELSWSLLRSVKYQDPVTFDVPVAETQLVVKATDQLSGVIDTLNGLVTSVCLDYDSQTGSWLKRPTSNPASLFRYVLQGPGSAKPLPDSLIDIPALEEWHEFCAAEGFEYNKVHDGQMSVQAVLNDICHAGRATFVLVDDARSVVIDYARVAGPVQLFTPENSVNFASSKAFVDEVHGYRVMFNNAEADYAEDEQVVYAEGYDAGNANLFEALQFPGVTDADQVAKLAKYHMATRRYRLETFSWEADWEHIVCNRGDLVRLSHPSILVALCSGRILAVDQVAKTITIDQRITVDTGTRYGLAVRTSPTETVPSQVMTLEVYAEAGETDQLSWQGTEPPSILPGDLYSAGELGSETLELVVTSKRPSANMRGTITALQYSWTEIAAYLAGSYPEHVTGITAPVFTAPAAPLPPSILSITGGRAVAQQMPDGSINSRIVVLVDIPSGGKVQTYEVHAEIKDGEGWRRSGCVDPLRPLVFNDISPGNVEVRVRSVSAHGTVSSWVYKAYVQTTAYAPPNAPSGLAVTSNLFQNDLSWSLPGDYRSQSRLEIWCATGVNDRSGAVLLATLSGGRYWSHSGLDPLVEYFYWLRVVGETGLVSAWYPESATGGVMERPLSDPGRIVGMLSESIGDGQLASALRARIDGAADGFVSHQELLENQWTLKIQENAGGEFYCAGAGLIVYPDWLAGMTVVAGADVYVWHEASGEVYRSIAAATYTAGAANEPPNTEYWQLVPYGRKSQFAIRADEFAVVNATGDGARVPFVITGGVVGIDGALVVDGSITADALHANALTSNNYVAGLSGFMLDATTGNAEFNNIKFVLNYNEAAASGTDWPEANATNTTNTNQLVDGAGLGLTSTWAGVTGSGRPDDNATAGAIWGSNIAGIPEASIYNADDATAFGYNPTFSDWTGGLPEGWLQWSVVAAVKDAAIVKTGKYCPKWTVPAGGQGGMRRSVSFRDAPLPAGTFVQGSFDMYLHSYVGPGKPGILVDLHYNATQYQRHVVVPETVAMQIGTWIKVPFVARVNPGERIESMQIYIMASYVGMPGGACECEVSFDNLQFTFMSGALDGATLAGEARTGAISDALANPSLSNELNGVGAYQKVPLPYVQRPCYIGCFLDNSSSTNEAWYKVASFDLNGGTYNSCSFNGLFVHGSSQGRFKSQMRVSIQAQTWSTAGLVEEIAYAYSGEDLTNYLRVYHNNGVVTFFVRLTTWQSAMFDGAWTMKHSNTSYSWIYSLQGISDQIGTNLTPDGTRFTAVANYTLGADITSENTSADTANVGGVSAATIRDNANSAKTAIANMAADGVFSAIEKRTWAEQWPGMLANYTTARAAAVAVDVSVTDLDGKKTALLNALTAYGVFNAIPVDMSWTAGYLSGLTANFYTALQAVIAATSIASSVNGANILPHSRLASWPTGWITSTGSGATACTYNLLTDASVWCLDGDSTLEVKQADENTTGYVTVQSDHIPVVQLGWYGASAYTGAHRCKVSLILHFYDSNKTWITDVTNSSTALNNSEKGGGSNLSQFKRITVKGQAPSNAMYVRVGLRKYGTNIGSLNSYMFLARAMLSEFTAGQTAFPAWSPCADELADKTSDNTSADTAKVGGTAAATIRDNAVAAKAAVVSMEADNKFSVAEKRTWQIQWPGIQANYSAVRTAAVAVAVNVTALDSARNSLYTFLNTTHNVFAGTPTESTFVQGDLSSRVSTFYTEMSNAITDTAANDSKRKLYEARDAAFAAGTQLYLNTNTGGVQTNSSYENGSKFVFNSPRATTAILKATLTDAEGGVWVGVNGVALRNLHYNEDGYANPDNCEWGHIVMIDLVAGLNEISLWSASSDGATRKKVEVRTTGAVGVADGADQTSTAVDNTLDTDTGGLIVRNTTSGKTAHLTGGDLTFYQYLDGVQRPVKSLKRIDAGTCNNGVQKILPGYWGSTPIVLVSPHDLGVYSVAFKDQDQALVCAPAEVVSVGASQYAFTPNAQLVVAGNTFAQDISASDSAAPTPGNTGYAGPVYILPVSNSSAVVVMMTCTAYCWRSEDWENQDKGTSGTTYWYYWCKYRTYWKVKQGSTWSTITYGAWTTRDSVSPFSLSATLTGTNITEIECGIEVYNASGYVESTGKKVTATANLTSINCTLAAHTVLATGTLNYMAISE
jgi:hypothetical protein